MNLVLNETMQVAYVYDWDQADWDAQSGTIPDSYTIEFNPSVDESTLNSLNTGRELWYTPRIVYVTEWIGSTMIVRPVTVYVQQLLPKPAPEVTS